MFIILLQLTIGTLVPLPMNFRGGFHPLNIQTGQNKKHVIVIFRSYKIYPKTKVIEGGHLKNSPCLLCRGQKVDSNSKKLLALPINAALT